MARLGGMDSANLLVTMTPPTGCLRSPRPASRRGFTLIEVSLALVVFAILVAIGTPRVSTYMTQARVQRATALIASDLEQAFAMAGRQRKPVRVSCDCPGMVYTVADRSDGTVRLTRALGADADFRLTTLTFSTTPVDILPSGVASDPLTVTVGAGGYTRRVSMTTAGLVRILP